MQYIFYVIYYCIPPPPTWESRVNSVIRLGRELPSFEFREIFMWIKFRILPTKVCFAKSLILRNQLFRLQNKFLLAVLNENFDGAKLEQSFFSSVKTCFTLFCYKGLRMTHIKNPYISWVIFSEGQPCFTATANYDLEYKVRNHATAKKSQNHVDHS